MMLGKTSREIAQGVNAIVQREQERQRGYHANWFVNLAFGGGKQWVIFNEEYRQVQEIVRTKNHQVRLVLNNINSIVWRAIAQLIRARPQPQAIPMSASESDRMAARGYQLYLDDIWNRENGRAISRDELLLWAYYCGRGWMRPEWDPDYGEVRKIALPREATVEDAVDPAGRNPNELLAEVLPQIVPLGMMGERPIPLGGVRLVSPSPFNVFMDPTAVRVADAKWIAEVAFVPRQSVKERYGVRSLEPDATPNMTPAYTKSLLEGLVNWGSMLASSLTGIGKDGKYLRGIGLEDVDDFEDMVLLKRLLVRPCKEYEQGKKLVVCNDRLLEDEENPYDGELNYALFQADPHPGSQYGGEPVTNLRDPQTALNRLSSQYIELINQHLKRKWLNPRAAKVDPADFNDGSRGVINYQENPFQAKPEMLQPSQVGGGEFMQAITLILNQMDRIAGLQKASIGVNPEGVRSARALTELQESDEEGRAPMQERFIECLTEAFRLVMKISKKYIREDRVIRTVGADGLPLAWEFTRAQVQAGYDVRVVVASGLPKSPEGRINAIGLMIERGMLDMLNPKDRQLAFKAMEFGEFLSVLDNDEGPERIRIHGENITMLRGQPAPVRNYDRHPMHIESHARFMRSPEAQAVFQLQPEIEKVFLEHFDQHMDWAEIPAANPASPLPEDAAATGGGPLPAPAPMGGLAMPGGGGEGEVSAGNPVAGMGLQP